MRHGTRSFNWTQVAEPPLPDEPPGDAQYEAQRLSDLEASRGGDSHAVAVARERYWAALFAEVEGKETRHGRV